MARMTNRAEKTRRPAQRRRRAARPQSRSANGRNRRRRPGGAITNRQSLQRLYGWSLPDDSIFAGLRLHGNTKWLPRCLVWLALCWALVDARHQVDAFDQALALCSSLFPCPLTT